jgi:hypothetical protein
MPNSVPSGHGSSAVPGKVVGDILDERQEQARCLVRLTHLHHDRPCRGSRPSLRARRTLHRCSVPHIGRPHVSAGRNILVRRTTGNKLMSRARHDLLGSRRPHARNHRAVERRVYQPVLGPCATVLQSNELRSHPRCVSSSRVPRSCGNSPPRAKDRLSQRVKTSSSHRAAVL